MVLSLAFSLALTMILRLSGVRRPSPSTGCRGPSGPHREPVPAASCSAGGRRSKHASWMFSVRGWRLAGVRSGHRWADDMRRYPRANEAVNRKVPPGVGQFGTMKRMKSDFCICSLAVMRRQAPNLPACKSQSTAHESRRDTAATVWRILRRRRATPIAVLPRRARSPLDRAALGTPRRHWTPRRASRLVVADEASTLRGSGSGQGRD